MNKASDIRSDKEVKVSVIVPVYNGERFLRRTLEDLTCQSLHDMEIICVDDCSSDKSADILNEYKENFEQIKVISCAANGGESKARNIGLKAAKGEYVAFMDQDDRVDSLFYEKLYEKAVETDADIAKGDCCDIFYDGRVFPGSRTPVSKSPMYFCGGWWTGIFRKALIEANQIELPEGNVLGGDQKFLFDVCRVANKVSADYSVSYRHVMHEDSGDSAKTSTAKIRSVLSIFAYILDGIENGGYYEKDIEVYRYYYVNYLFHLTDRIRKCESPDGRMMCLEFIYDRFSKCKCKEYILENIKNKSTLFYRTLKSGDIGFHKRILSGNKLSDAFFSREEHSGKHSGNCTVVVPFINRDEVARNVLENSFIRGESSLFTVLIDNSEENKGLSIRYNEFLDGYDYSNDSWLIFMHSDFEFLDYPSDVLAGLDKTKIYGPVGVKSCFCNGKTGFFSKGLVYEQDFENIIYENFINNCEDMSADTLDCMCLMVHSSLIAKYGLRFDENLLFDLYVEDFCINAKKLYGIESYALCFDCAHHSSYVSEGCSRESYRKALKYINTKYPNDIYGGTVSPVGGGEYSEMSKQEMTLFTVRQKIRTGQKI